MTKKTDRSEQKEKIEDFKELNEEQHLTEMLEAYGRHGGYLHQYVYDFFSVSDDEESNELSRKSVRFEYPVSYPAKSKVDILSHLVLGAVSGSYTELDLYIVGECKKVYDKQKAWVFPRPLREEREFPSLAKVYAKRMQNYERYEYIPSHLISWGELHTVNIRHDSEAVLYSEGYEITQNQKGNQNRGVFSNDIEFNKSTIEQALNQVCGQALGVIKKFDDLDLSDEDEVKFVGVIPVIVTNAPLYSLCYDSEDIDPLTGCLKEGATGRFQKEKSILYAHSFAPDSGGDPRLSKLVGAQSQNFMETVIIVNASNLDSLIQIEESLFPWAYLRKQFNDMSAEVFHHFNKH